MSELYNFTKRTSLVQIANMLQIMYIIQQIETFFENVKIKPRKMKIIKKFQCTKSKALIKRSFMF